MRRVNINLQNIELKPGDLLVIYRGKATEVSMEENSIAVKGNYKRDKVVEKIFELISDQY